MGRVSDLARPLRAAKLLKPPALPGDTYLSGVTASGAQQSRTKLLRRCAPRNDKDGLDVHGDQSMIDFTMPQRGVIASGAKQSRAGFSRSIEIASSPRSSQ